MILQSGDDPAIEADNLKLCRQNRVSGVFACVTSYTSNMDPFVKLKDLDIPVVFFDKVPADSNYNKVCVADVASATIAAETIIQQKKKKILALFGNEQLLITKKRMDAFTKTIGKKAKLLVQHAHNSAEAELAATKMLQQKPDVVFCMSDEILIGAMKAIQKAGLKIPTDIGVMAISNGYIPKLYFPEITYAETSGYKLGKLAFSSMMACIAGSTVVQELTTDALLVPGSSL
jgi:LacI family transcriptional regulator